MNGIHLHPDPQNPPQPTRRPPGGLVKPKKLTFSGAQEERWDQEDTIMGIIVQLPFIGPKARRAEIHA
jgi:hypothetical protein